MFVLRYQVLKLLSHRETEFEERFEPHGNAAQSFVVAQDQSDLWRRVIGHGDGLPLEKRRVSLRQSCGSIPSAAKPS